jgi:FkbM family methyltransferase
LGTSIDVAKIEVARIDSGVYQRAFRAGYLRRELNSMTIYERIQTYHRLLRYRYHDEKAELRFLLGRQYRRGSLLDVGAHRGEYSYWLHRKFRDDVRVVTFEPQPELAMYLTDFKRAFRLDRMTIVPFGLSSRGGKLRMHRPRSKWAAATVDEFWNDDAETDVFDVPVTTIDEYLTEHPKLRPVRFIKCDVESHETEVLIGAERTLREDRPELLVEWSKPRRASRERLFGFMHQLGYSMYQFESGRLVPCTTSERHCPPSWELGANYVMLPREAAGALAA